MVLNVVVDGARYHPRTWPETSELLDRIMRWQHTWFPSFGVGDQVALSIGESRLHVRVNSFTGYGSLIWYVADQGCWLTDNPSPPAFDPLVLAEPGGPQTFDPRSTLPVARIREAVEEFCRTATGKRPTSVSWVPGDLGGVRHDQERGRYHDDVTAPLREAILGEPAKLRVLGALRVLRMLPILAATGASFVEAAAEICEVRGRDSLGTLDEQIRVIEPFDGFESDEGPGDAGFRYARMVVAGAALMLARPDEEETQFGTYEYSTCSFWSVCHRAVLKPEPRAWEVATVMRDAEETCRVREAALLMGSSDPDRVFRDERLRMEREGGAALSRALAAARHAGWVSG
ncbi:Imm1 family immunity protein [Paractinoplanes globisporus]|uniref:Imm1 family immunity protein n=1 Tax=Paractinoplanes globisporus TaxID=113565 RepID=A0ABW6W8I8_9ACTN|nr:Imm1 family immunity protein [Actinoplanes globisporus]